MKKLIFAVMLALIAGCSSSGNGTAGSTTPATAAPQTTAQAQGCLTIPASFFSDIEAHGHVVKSGAVKSSQQAFNGHDLYEVGAKFDNGDVAVWSVASDPGETFHGFTVPMNDAARAHSDQGVDAPASVIPDDADGVQRATDCVS